MRGNEPIIDLETMKRKEEDCIRLSLFNTMNSHFSHESNSIITLDLQRKKITKEEENPILIYN